MFDKHSLKIAVDVGGAMLIPYEIDQIYEEACERSMVYRTEFHELLEVKYENELGCPVSEVIDDATLNSKSAQIADDFAYTEYVRPLIDRATGHHENMVANSDISTIEVLQSPTLWKVHWGIFLTDLVRRDAIRKRRLQKRWAGKVGVCRLCEPLA
ncbi:hypothetical protein [Corynebacterium casei]|uniref:hypothetical protein n=1 Tax=Corynebacterium casei TaxID=160386 RepID=UPI00264874C8|nr:hypothetical protein [Corynebacterium casei]MDN5705679.1 hypothetical protein [Corynebacterium casei]